MTRYLNALWGAALASALAVPAALAAVSETFEAPTLSARLVTVEDGIGPDAATVSAGLHLDLEEGWKTYWRSPGEVGLPPSIDWSASENVAGAEMLWPAPTRFRAFGIENFGYADEVLHPIRIILDEPGAPAQLRASVSLLACADICVPLDFDLNVVLSRGTGVDRASAALVGTWADRVPAAPETVGMGPISAAFEAGGDALVVELERAEAWGTPDVFAELGPGLGGAAVFGPPDIRLSNDRRALWARLPIIGPSDPPSPLRLTVVDGAVAATFDDVGIAPRAPAPPREMAAEARPLSGLAWIALLAFAGGLVLNVMPCVLPVLSIKLSSAIGLARADRARVRAGFLATACGAVAFMWALAAFVLVLRSFGYAVGWGTQFQNPTFLAALVLMLGLFSASLMGLFEFRLPQALGGRIARVGGTGLAGDFATGAFAAVLATPCSAPLLGTAVAFALTGSAADVLVVFTAMGIGLASPYLALAARPGIVARLPRPGRWMLAVKAVLGLLLAGTVAWLLWVLAGVGSPPLAGATLLLLAATLAAIAFARRMTRWRGTATVAALSTALLLLTLPGAMTTATRTGPEGGRIAWVSFERSAIARHVSRGHVVLVDVTADWCLTCKANKALVLDREPVVSALAAQDVIAMQADWTRPDPKIAAFLEANDRFGIPFDAVYGPARPGGIVLPELLSTDGVMTAISEARGGTPDLARSD